MTAQVLMESFLTAGILVSVYGISIIICYYTSRQYFIKEDIEPTALDVFIVFCPVLNMAIGVIRFFKTFSAKKFFF